MLYIAVCDDNRQVCSEMETILLEYSKKTGVMLEVEVFYNGESFLNYQEQGNMFDLVYLDIEMEQGNGLEVGHQLRNVWKNYGIEIVYISGKEGYDRKLFEYQPLHFLTKPFSKEELIGVLELAMVRAKKQEKFFEYKKRTEIHRVPVHEILYFESLKREVRIVTDKGEDIFYAILDEIEKDLSDSQFVRIHRSYFINYNPSSEEGSDEKYFDCIIQKAIELGAIGINSDFRGVSDMMVKKIHENGLLVSLWTANRKKDMLKALSLSPDNITTKKPDKLKMLIK